MTGARAPRPVRLALFVVVYGWHYLKANVQVAATILTGRPRLAPALVEVRLRCRTDAEVAAYMGLITLTPGTMAVSLSPDRTRLIVHGMHASDTRSEEHTSELQSLMRISYAVLCLKKKKNIKNKIIVDKATKGH